MGSKHPICCGNMQNNIYIYIYNWNIGGRKDWKQQQECVSFTSSLFSALTFNLKTPPMKGLQIIQAGTVEATKQGPLQCKQERDFVYADRANQADQNLSSNIYFHIVNVNILRRLWDRRVTYSNCTNQGQTHPFKV